MSQLLQYYKSFSSTSRSPAASSQNSAPTFEDLAIDDNLSPLQRIVSYSKSSIGLQRLVHVKMIADVAKSVGHKDTTEHILPVLAPLAQDSEPAIKQQLVQQMSALAKFCVQNEDEGYAAVVKTILPLTALLLEDEKADVRLAASMTLVDIAQLLRPDDLGKHILTVVLQLAHEDDNEETRMTAAELLNMLAESMGQDLCQQFIIPEIVSLAEDPVFRVRKSTALNFHNICKVGGEHELFERLMPAFVRLSKDDMYRVRRACAESLYNIAQYVSDDIKVGVLVEIFLRFMQDPSRLVKQSILQQSGMFLSTLPSRCINETLLGHFSSMASGPTGDLGTDNELRQHCAFTFPAVALTVGSERWGELRGTYHLLVQSRSTAVRQTLAASLHEIAAILKDQKTVEEELVPVFEELIQDIESVQMGVVKYLAKFLAHLSRNCRISYIPEMHNILHTVNPFNWRLRECVAVQLPVLIDMPGAENVYVTLFPLVMTLLQDPVARVRKGSFEGVAKMVVVLAKLTGDLVWEEGDEKAEVPASEAEKHRVHLDSVIRAINSLATGDTFQLRQLWAELCLVLLKKIPRSLFEKHFLDGILLLTPDPIGNVRLAVLDVLVDWGPEYPPPPVEGGEEGPEESDYEGVHPWEWLLARDDVRVCVERFSHDEQDVYRRLLRLQPYYPDIEFSWLETPSSRPTGKGAPGGDTVIVNSVTGLRADEAFLQYSTSDERDSLHSSDISSVDVERLRSESGGQTEGGPSSATSPNSNSSGSSTVFVATDLDADMVQAFGGGGGGPDSPVKAVDVPARPASPPREDDLDAAFFDPLAPAVEVEEEISTEPEFQPVPKDI